MGASLTTHLKADDVCAFLWGHADRYRRAVACALAGVTEHPTVEWGWHEIDPADRAKLVAAFAYEVETEIPQVKT